MAFYLRNDEILLLQRQLWLAEHQRSRMTLITGTARCGKSAFALQALQGRDVLYFKSGNRTESMMMAEFSEQVSRKLKKNISDPPKEICTMLKLLMGYSSDHTITVIIDGFDYYSTHNGKQLYNFCEIWTEYRLSSHINLVIIVDNEALLPSLFEDEGSPLSGQPDLRIRLDNFSISELKSVLDGAGRKYTNEDLLLFYGLTGCVPEYVGRTLKCDSIKMADVITSALCEGSYYLKEGDNILNSVIGHNKDIYISILQAIASGQKSQSDIETVLGGGNVGGYLYKLENEYGLIIKSRPVLSDGTERNVVRYEIRSTFLLIWLRIIDRNRDMVASGDFEGLVQYALKDFNYMSKYLLIRYFRSKLKEQYGLSSVGGQWEPSKKTSERLKKRRSPNPLSGLSAKSILVGLETDILFADHKSQTALVAAVEKSEADFNKTAFLKNSSYLEKGPLKGYKIDSRLFTLEDM